MRNIVICSDASRRRKIESEFALAGLHPEFMDGVFVEMDSFSLGNVVKKPGNVGCMLAKLKCWDLVATGEEPCNIFEDDEVVPPDYIAKRASVLDEAGEYDFVFLNALRPAGNEHSGSLLRVSSSLPNREPVRNYSCNVWNSNYVITPGFSRTLAELLLAHGRLSDVFAGSTSDWIISDILHKCSDNRRIFVVRESDLISVHDEQISIRRGRN
jgi:hypothetical protein